MVPIDRSRLNEANVEAVDQCSGVDKWDMAYTYNSGKYVTQSSKHLEADFRFFLH